MNERDMAILLAAERLHRACVEANEQIKKTLRLLKGGENE